jgi:hypothetical protein
MSEQVTPILPVSSQTLRRAVIRLDTRKHPAKAEAIERELLRRAAEMRRAA